VTSLSGPAFRNRGENRQAVERTANGHGSGYPDSAQTGTRPSEAPTGFAGYWPI
jgi:hypothetical protein